MSNPQTAKKDGIEWTMYVLLSCFVTVINAEFCRKKEAFRTPVRVQESTVELKVNGVEVIHGVYCKTVDYMKNLGGNANEVENMVRSTHKAFPMVS